MVVMQVSQKVCRNSKPTRYACIYHSAVIARRD